MTATVLVLAHACDMGANLVAAGLRSDSRIEGVRIIRPESLSLARWSHRIDERGRASTRFELPSTEPVVTADVGAALNRIRYLSVPRFSRSSAKNRDYAGVELQALVTSWLAELGNRVVHVVRNHPWLTPMIPLQRWAGIATECGLPVAARTVSTSPRLQHKSLSWHGNATRNGRNDVTAICASEKCFHPDVTSVLVAGNETGGPVASRFGPACLAAAGALGFPLLEFRFAIVKGEMALIEVDPLPPLTESWAVLMVSRLLKKLAREPL